MVGPGGNGPAGPRTLVVTIGEVDGPAWMPLLCAAVSRALVVSHAERLVCDVATVRHPDAATVDMLARLQLTARRAGSSACIRAASPELLWLVRLMGLEEVLGGAETSGVDAVWQPEEGEELLGIQEERDPTDPVA